MNRWLASKGYLHSPATSSIQATVYSFLKERVSTRLAHALRDAVASDGASGDSEGDLRSVYRGAFGHERTTAFSYGTRSAKIYVRDDAVTERLIEDLRSMRVDGHAPVDSIHRFDGIDGPDLVVKPEPPYSFETSLSESGLTAGVDLRTDTHIGTHGPEGILIASGPEIAGGESIGTPHIVDALPTILSAVEEAIPGYVDGEVIRSAFTESTLASREPTFDEEAVPEMDRDVGHGESGDVRERLKELGYL